ncbi:aromatic amino acid transporter [Suttonella sp. R2A3]|uniref:aromatic amino acid transporter n=1 Tax=Suttonella sp. R2A3 TaxID=2908648 RepID=UPI001F24EA5E|nr:aromatic amino acid transporter [Suttonella sp. R2A3]UJF23951.1 aromatic amino acid transporter [Suttonella sp. R2A3]
MSSIKHIAAFIAATFIVIGTAVGAGMIAIPTATSGLWYGRSLIILFITWLVMMTTSLMILEASQGFDRRAHFPTMVKQLLGNRWALLNSLSLGFVLYILVYAYIAVGGDITSANIASLSGHDTPIWVGQLIFFAVLGLVVWLSHHWVARFNALILGGLLLTFFLASGALLPSVQLNTLIPEQDVGNWRYVWLSLPVVLTSFGYHINVPTLRVYLADRTSQIAWALIIGSFSVLLLYILWQTAVQGNLPRSEFAPVIASGGQVSQLIDAMRPYVLAPSVVGLLALFSYFAIATSFLGVALGLFEFISDFCHFNDSRGDRFKTAIIAFVAPLALCLWQPYGFVSAIAYAGVALTIWGIIIPALMVRKTREQGNSGRFRVPGGKLVILLVIIFAVLNILAQGLADLGLVAKFSG